MAAHAYQTQDKFCLTREFEDSKKLAKISDKPIITLKRYNTQIIDEFLQIMLLFVETLRSNIFQARCLRK